MLLGPPRPGSLVGESNANTIPCEYSHDPIAPLLDTTYNVSSP